MDEDLFFGNRDKKKKPPVINEDREKDEFFPSPKHAQTEQKSFRRSNKSTRIGRKHMSSNLLDLDFNFNKNSKNHDDSHTLSSVSDSSSLSKDFNDTDDWVNMSKQKHTIKSKYLEDDVNIERNKTKEPSFKQ